jgi:hypothetical protein
VKNIRLGFPLLLVVVLLLSGCVPTPVVTTKVSPTETNPLIEESQTLDTVDVSTETVEPTPTPTLEPTQEPTLTPTNTPTITPTPEPVLWCSDVIENCYFIGSEIARIFAVMTLPCFELGEECYPPVEECSNIPSSVVHVLVEDWAVAWEEEVTGNPNYNILEPDLYDPETQYCFVDEGIAQMIRDSGSVGYQANKSCLDNDDMPCDIVLQLTRIYCDLNPSYCTIFKEGAYLTYSSFVAHAKWADFTNAIDTELQKTLYDGLLDYPDALGLFRVYTSTAVGFNELNENPPADIFTERRKD